MESLDYLVFVSAVKVELQLLLNIKCGQLGQTSTLRELPEDGVKMGLSHGVNVGGGREVRHQMAHTEGVVH